MTLKVSKYAKKDSFKSDEAYEKALEASRKWKRENKERVKEYARVWDSENVDRKKRLKADWDKANPEKRKEHLDKLLKNNPEYFKEKHIQYQYGMTAEEYAVMVIRQGNNCATCGKPADETHRKRLFVDHCHRTGKIRGLLCQHCNTALGMVKDDVNVLSSLIAYLQENTQ